MATQLQSRYSETERTSQVTPGQAGEVESAGVTRWLWVWVTIGLLVVLVVVAFLIGISNALVSIDDALGVATPELGEVGGHVQPLPDQIDTVNQTLGSIDESLLPVPGQAQTIVSELSSIRGSLQQVDSSLIATLNSLANTSGSLVNTGGGLTGTGETLRSVEGIAFEILNVLERTQSTGAPAGTGTAADNIWMRVDIANGVLTAAKGDTGNVLPQLVHTDAHLESICAALPTPGPC